MLQGHTLDFRAIGVEGTYTLSSVPSIPIHVLSIYNNKDKSIYTCKHVKRGTLKIESVTNQGAYGNIYVAKRIQDASENLVYVKQPKFTDMNLTQEGILQHLAQSALALKGLGWAIPRIFDIFQKDDHVCFSMERVEGVSLVEWIEKQDTSCFCVPFLLFLAQVCLLLWLLETEIGFDHRDLKANNLFICPRPCTLSLTLGGKQWVLQCPFQVVLIDFGFACLGSARGQSIVNLGDGVLPPMDPCPKEGRDIFHLLISLMTLNAFQSRLSPELKDRIDHWLAVGNKSYGHLARRYSQENWVYLVTSQRNFAVPACSPCSLLEELRGDLGSLLTCLPLTH